MLINSKPTIKLAYHHKGSYLKYEGYIYQSRWRTVFLTLSILRQLHGGSHSEQLRQMLLNTLVALDRHKDKNVVDKTLVLNSFVLYRIKFIVYTDAYTNQYQHQNLALRIPSLN